MGGGERPVREYSAYVGTYEGGGRPSLFHVRCDARTGRLRLRGAVSDVVHPSFLALHPRGGHLYAASEAPGGPDGEVCAFALDPRTGDPTFLHRRPAHGRSTCHVSVDADGRVLVAANYGSPTIVLYRLGEDGGLAAAAVVMRHDGHSVHPRQREPHPHSANVDPSGRFVYCPDLGTDRIMIYRLDRTAGTLAANDPPWVGTAPGAGPRHLAFHPALDAAYAVNEIDSTVAAYARDADSGALRPLQVASTLPAGFRDGNSCADVHVHPSGRFVYASNRGHDSIAVFRVDPASGRLEPAGHAATGGRTPRNFALDPAGRFLFAENQDSGSIVTFAVDPATGVLEPTGDRLELPTPVCLRFGRAWTAA